MSNFDAEAFLNMEVQGAMETNFKRCPEGEWPTFIRDVAIRQAQTKNGTATILDVDHVITDERVKQELQMEEPTVRQSIFLDIEQNGALQFGPNKNVVLGKLREAAGQNDPSKPWSFRLLIGAGPFIVTVKQSPDENNPGDVFSNVKKVVRAS